MRFRIWCAVSAVTSCFNSSCSSVLLYSARIIKPSRLYAGCAAEHDQHSRIPVQQAITARSRFEGLFFAIAAAIAGLGRPASSGLFDRMTEQFRHTHRSIFRVVFMNEIWYMGFANSMWPKWPGHSLCSIPQVEHLKNLSIEPRRRSISPPCTGFPFSNVRSESQWHTDIALISSGPSTPNCTCLTRFTSASLCRNMMPRADRPV
mmetsp:Transcript_40611/g.100848  ORF Transcript_40611/g.100848 Transcript_40611/m.100848 type:complete len:205 (-) Transcript_40611:134-748(-)